MKWKGRCYEQHLQKDDLLLQLRLQRMYAAQLQGAQEVRLRAEQPCVRMDPAEDQPRTEGIGQGVILMAKQEPHKGCGGTIKRDGWCYESIDFSTWKCPHWKCDKCGEEWWSYFDTDNGDEAFDLYAEDDEE